MRSPATPLKPPLKILACVTSLHPRSGGIAAVNRNVLSAFARMRYNRQSLNIHVLALQDAPNEMDADHRWRFANVHIEPCRSRRLRFCRRFLQLCLGMKPNFVFVDHLHLAVVPYLSARLSPPYVLFCHGTEFNGRLSRLRIAAYRAAALRLANSHFTANRLMTMFPTVLPETCDLGLEEPNPAGRVESSEPARIPPIPNAFGDACSVGRRAILIVGRLSALERYKGHDQLILLMPSLTEQFPDAQLVIVGEGDDQERLKERARLTGAGRSILFTGFASSQLLADLYARCRLFAMPSRGEGFGLVYLEAMRFAKPCLVSRTDAGCEVVIDGVTGLHVDPGDLEEIRRAVIRLLEDDHLAERLGQAGLDRVNNHYRFHHFCERLQSKLSALCPSLYLVGQPHAEYPPFTTHCSPLTNSG